jgi:hypothetical protein
MTLHDFVGFGKRAQRRFQVELTVPRGTSVDSNDEFNQAIRVRQRDFDLRGASVQTQLGRSLQAARQQDDQRRGRLTRPRRYT